MSILSFKNRPQIYFSGGVPTFLHLYSTIHLLEKSVVQNSSKLSPTKEITEEENTRGCRHYTIVHKPAVERDGGWRGATPFTLRVMN